MLIEKIIRERILESLYWKEQCFGLTAATFCDRAVAIGSVGGQYGAQHPTEFICLIFKMLQIQPEREILLQYLDDEGDFKYLRALAAFYIRLTFSAIEVYQILEPLLSDSRKLRMRTLSGGYDLTYMDEFVDELLTQERVCGIALPKLRSRYVLEESEDLEPRQSALDSELDDDVDDDEDPKSTP